MIATILLPAAGTLLLASPAAPFLALYRWDTSTWPDRTALAAVQRARRLGYRLPRRTPAQRALADLATADNRHGVLDPAALPPARPVTRDPLTQPVLARVDLRRDTIPPPPGRLARLRHAHHGRPA
jgi:hypothetical protein